MRARQLAKGYPWVAGTLVALLITLALEGAGSDLAQVVATAFGAVVLVKVAIGMVKDLLRGHWGIDILAVTAIAATLLVGEYLAALVVCLMLTGGEALDRPYWVPCPD